jgi:hypothetical protein
LFAGAFRQIEELLNGPKAFSKMLFGSPTAEVCREITSELQDVAGWFSGQGITPEQFCQFVVVFEAAKLQRLGFQLSSQVSSERKVHFSLRAAESGELCGSMDVDPVTGLSEVQHTC